jgi:hypothetical protein
MHRGAKLGKAKVEARLLGDRRPLKNKSPRGRELEKHLVEPLGQLAATREICQSPNPLNI